MERIEHRIIEAAIHTLGTCPGCGEGGCVAGRHCPCDGCECWRDDPANAEYLNRPLEGYPEGNKNA